MTEQSEKDFQAEVIKVAKGNNWWSYHTFDSRRSEPGMIDLFMVKGIYLNLWELKTDTGKCTDAQATLLEALEKVKVLNVAVKRPRDMDDILRRLKR